MRDIDWEDLRHFTALARTLNLARAATELGTSQVTVMRRVRALEEALGSTLFLRRRDGHRLTPAGADLFRSSQEAGDLIRDAAARVGRVDRAAAGRVRLVTTELAANWILLPALPAFIAGNADIALEIDASPEAQRLDDDAETVALRFRRPERGTHRIRKLGAMRFSLYAHISLRNTADGHLPVIGWAGPIADIGLARWLRHATGDRPPVLALTTFAGHVDAARRGVGAAALPDFIGGREPALSQVPVSAPGFVLDAWLVVPQQIAAIERIRRVARFVEAAVHAELRGLASGRDGIPG